MADRVQVGVCEGHEQEALYLRSLWRVACGMWRLMCAVGVGHRGGPELGQNVATCLCE